MRSDLKQSEICEIAEVYYLPMTVALSLLLNCGFLPLFVATHM